MAIPSSFSPILPDIDPTGIGKEAFWQYLLAGVSGAILLDWVTCCPLFRSHAFQARVMAQWERTCHEVQNAEFEGSMELFCSSSGYGSNFFAVVDGSGRGKRRHEFSKSSSFVAIRHLWPQKDM